MTGKILDHLIRGAMIFGLAFILAAIGTTDFIPVYAQVGGIRGGGGGSTTITSGTTPITGGATTQVCYNQGGTLKCGDAGLVYDEATDIMTIGVQIRTPSGTNVATTVGPNASTGMYFTGNVTNFSIAGTQGFSISNPVTTFFNFVPTTNGTLDLGTSALSFRELYIDQTITGAGTTGNVTINKSRGTARLAAAASSLTVTSSLATATTLVFLTPQGAVDTTCRSFTATRAAGSFVITANAACTSETEIAFWF